MPTAAARRPIIIAATALMALLAVSMFLPPAATAESTRVGRDELYNADLLVSPAASPLPQTGAKSFVVADLDTGAILAAHNAHQPLPPASTLKMLTALTVLPRLDPEAVYTATAEDVDVVGSRVGIVAGSTYTGRQLLEAMFLVSGNDAAMALARMNGSVADTLVQMQAQAGLLQANDTVVRNPSGLDSSGQVSSAYDLALIARAGMSRADFAGLAALPQSTFPGEGTGDPAARPSYGMWNQNDLVTGHYSGGLGVKSGYTTNAGRTLATAAERDGKRYLVTMMGIEGRTYETGALYLDWAIANGATAEPVGSLVAPRLGDAASDTAAVVPAGERIPAETLASGIVEVPNADSGSGRGRWFLAGLTLALCLLIREGLRAPYRRAIRRRNRPHGLVRAAGEDIVVGLRPRRPGVPRHSPEYAEDDDWARERAASGA